MNRIAFVLNLMFVACIVLRLLRIEAEGAWLQMLVAGGLVLSFPFNIILMTTFLLRRLQKKASVSGVIAALNFIVFLFQMAYFVLI